MALTSWALPSAVSAVAAVQSEGAIFPPSVANGGGGDDDDDDDDDGDDDDDDADDARADERFILPPPPVFMAAAALSFLLHPPKKKCFFAAAAAAAAGGKVEETSQPANGRATARGSPRPIRAVRFSLSLSLSLSLSPSLFFSAVQTFPCSSSNISRVNFSQGGLEVVLLRGEQQLHVSPLGSPLPHCLLQPLFCQIVGFFKNL